MLTIVTKETIKALQEQGFSLAEIGRLAYVKSHHREFVPAVESQEMRRWKFARHLYQTGALRS